MIVDFFLMFHKDKPIDWLLDHILWVKVCNPEKDAVSTHEFILLHCLCMQPRCGFTAHTRPFFLIYLK